MLTPRHWRRGGGRFVRRGRAFTLLAGPLILALTVAFPAQAEWYPQRPVYDYNRYDPKNEDCSDPSSEAANHGRCGPVDGPVFNSFINTPEYGDEREFFDGRRTRAPEDATADDIRVTPSGDEQAVLRIYVNNDANESYGARTVASGTRVRVALPSADDQVLRARAYISADNAIPDTVEDTVDLLSPQSFKVKFVRGSAVLLRGNTKYPLSDDIVTEDGALIGDNDMNGVFPAGFDKSALVELRVAIEPSDYDWTAAVGIALGILAALATAVFVAQHRTRAAAAGALGWLLDELRQAETRRQIIAGLVLAASAGLLAIVVAALAALIRMIA